ncbi:DUF1501 domain-containing protein [Ramlibacter pallidus]|uniref:DUF1501 domain-containing protein n=1 Tax=Ramlibacter pallidus TaxID=2780087 RepID=A0ABR9S208_9BURK|nr:DUF1501 domain-containing protein [Ramlibacter pallidus]MBE7367535.1 DUF1501 domain-containing protein [Ramlibacter pallidus]
MHFDDIPPDNASRRAFLRRSAALSIAAGAAPWAMSLAAMGEAAAQAAGDYKALVCVFLYGGNDQANTLVPYDAASHEAYRLLRPNLALDRAALAATALNPATPLAGGLQYALAPGLAPLVPVFDASRMAVLLNVGPLVQPTTKAQYSARSVPLPPKLFSHNDQQSYWQSSLPEGARTGWGGRLGDLFASGNGNATFTCISVSGNAVYLTGQSAVQYQVGSGGAVPVNGVRSPLFGSAACSTAMRTLITQPRTHLLENEYATVTRRSVESHEQLSSALAGVTLPTTFPTGNGLASQLQTVARLIAERNTLGSRRQVFFVSLGGFDTHDALAVNHPNLMAAVGNALGAFYQATVDLGVADQVTTFTASDFGRTLVSNNDGSDHGWGSMHFVLGGAVQGRRFVGTPPVVASGGPDDVGQGRLLPTMAVEQLAGTLATWLGVSATDQLALMPNLSNFSTRNLGFMA